MRSRSRPGRLRLGDLQHNFDPSALDLADRLPDADGKKAFHLSTYGAPAFVADREFIEKNHRQIREKLKAKGYTVIGEFGCAGWNTNSFLHFFGGLNKGRPNTEDHRNAEEFARRMKRKALLNRTVFYLVFYPVQDG